MSALDYNTLTLAPAKKITNNIHNMLPRLPVMKISILPYRLGFGLRFFLVASSYTRQMTVNAASAPPHHVTVWMYTTDFASNKPSVLSAALSFCNP